MSNEDTNDNMELHLGTIGNTQAIKLLLAAIIIDLKKRGVIEDGNSATLNFLNISEGGFLDLPFFINSKFSFDDRVVIASSIEETLNHVKHTISLSES